MKARIKPFYVYSILDSQEKVIYIGKGTKEERLMKDIGTRVYVARMLLKYYLSFKYLSSKVDNLYTKDLTETFNALNVIKLREVAYG